MINLDKQFSIILEKFKLIENSLNNMNNIDSNELIKLNREYSSSTNCRKNSRIQEFTKRYIKS